MVVVSDPAGRERESLRCTVDPGAREDRVNARGAVVRALTGVGVSAVVRVPEQSPELGVKFLEHSSTVTCSPLIGSVVRVVLGIS